MKFTKEQLEKVKSAEELLTLAHENGVELTKDEAKEFCDAFSKRNELTDEELSGVTGGDYYSTERYKSKENVEYIFEVGDIVEVRNWFYIGTVRCRITEVKIEWDEVCNTGAPGMPGTAFYDAGWIDKYYCQELENHWYFPNDWYPRSMLQIPNT